MIRIAICDDEKNIRAYLRTLVRKQDSKSEITEDTAGEITGILKESAHELGKCVIVVTHSNELAAQADVVLYLKRGSLHTI